MKIYKLIILSLIIFLIKSTVQAQIKIKYKIGDEIITNIDIINERQYLIFLRPELKNLSKNEMLEISKNSLIREIIKKKEIKKLFKDLNNPILIKEIKKKLLKFKNVNNEDELLRLVNNLNIEYEDIIEKMKYEAFWNELIFQKYNSLIKINEEKLKLELIEKISSNKKYEYNLSEILFEVDKNEKIEKKYKEILNYIKLNDFKTAASKFSISGNSKRGGEIGWVKETLLSKDLNSNLKKVKKGDLSFPIKYPNGYLILKINDKKEMKQTINIDEELKEMINFEKNKQLNQFSILFYKKLKQNSIINEY
tara:strand:+ start:30 stop:956 length:927 start_codon:yes stop_codon:yes gene_type:complete